MAMSPPQGPATPPRFLSAEATRDERLLPSGAYLVLKALEQKCAIYLASPTVFVSAIRRKQKEDSASYVVLDCRSRELVQQQVFQETVTMLSALTMAVRLPAHQQCTSENRKQFCAWLKLATHLKTVYIFDSLPVKDALSSNGMLPRIFKYMVKCETKPKKIVLLASGLSIMASLPLPIVLISSVIPIYAITAPKVKCSIGMFVVNAEVTKSSEGRGPVELFNTCAHLGVKLLVNLSMRPLGYQVKGIQQIQPGPQHLPLKTQSGASAFYQSLFESLVSAAEHKANMCFIDNPSRGLTALAAATILILVGGQSASEAIELVRNRLEPPDFDGFALAAFSHLADHSLANRSERAARAVACLAERFNTVERPDSKEEVPEANILLQGAQPRALGESWKEIETLMTGLPRPKVETVFELISRLFNNIILQSEDQKYRRIRAQNPNIARAFGSNQLGPEILRACGWVHTKDDMYVLPPSANIQILRDALVFMASS